ncbi:Phosphoglucosamine mutase [Candidatus Hepatincolaceae symbiont of Richtersius coronifer]
MKTFGTDGIRGKANEYPMTSEIILQVGMAAALHLGSSETTNRVVIGKDTRLSGYMFETALTSGLTSMGKDVLLVGPMPTPAVAMLTKSIRADLGIMISASHNPYYDNGIKLFDKYGYKLSDESEQAIEALLGKDFSPYLVKSSKVGRVERLQESVGRYIEYIKSHFPQDASLSGLKIVVDCANGAAYKVAPTILYELGAIVIPIGINPNGFNINQQCGSTDIKELRLKVLESEADIGIAFDGDADRLIIIDERGNVIDGDKILAILATHWHKVGKLKNHKVVGTIMANLSFEKYLNSQKIELIRTSVGDRYVSEGMQQHQCNLGGEQSGHVILSDYSTTGDAILAALEVLSIIVISKQSASKVCNLYKAAPQILKNLKYNTDSNPLEDKNIIDFIENQQKKYQQDYRIVVRKSGTEKLIRVMVEGEKHEETSMICDNIIDKISAHIN